MPTEIERFWAKVEKTDGCWIWRASRDSSGYGTFGSASGTVSAHRYSYKMANGPVPLGLELDHLCRNTRCVRPDHLEAVTHAENKRRRYALVTQCVNGHQYNEANTYWRPSGERDCRACIRERVKRYKAKRGAA